jgi:GT2 family glycosyltransferase
MVVYDSIRPETVGSIYPLAKFAYLDIVSGCYVDKGRNVIAERVTEPFLLFVDSDMSFTNDDLTALKNALDEDKTIGAIGGVYIQRVGSYKPICHWIEEQDGEKVWVSGREVFERTIRYMDEGAIADVDSFGTGFLLIRVEAMKEIGKPYFETKYDEKTRNFWGEDVLFCKRLKEAGWRSCIHFGVQPAHFGVVGFVPNQMRQIPLPEKSDEEVKHAVQ